MVQPEGFYFQFLLVQKKRSILRILLFRYTPEGTRTPNTQNRNLVPYPLDHGCINEALSQALIYYSNLRLKSKEEKRQIFTLIL